MQDQVDPRVAHINLPPNFHISVFAEVPTARSMSLSPNGILYVGNRRNGNVVAVIDRDGDSQADEVKTIAEGLFMPNGVAYRDGDLYVAEVNRVLKFSDIDNNLENPVFTVLKDDLPSDRSHGWKYIKFGPDGKLYLPIGAPCNICDEGDPYATINRMNPDGTGFEIVARGIRNTVGFDWDPIFKELWFTDNGRDSMGDDVPADELNNAPVNGMHFGYPYCHGGDVADPEFGFFPCELFSQPAYKFQAHSANLGITFYTGSMFPEKYRNGAFVAQHGSWNRSKKVGYRVMFMTIADRKVVSAEVFADGWLEGENTLGRPVAFEMTPDGGLLVSDDHTGLIYKITYKAP